MAIWGIAAGAVLGLTLAGPLGAVLGAVAGHILERWWLEFRARATLGTAAAPSDPAEAQRAAFATAVIVLAAKLSKADGAVSRIEVDTFKEVFDVRDEDVTGGIAPIFDAARRSPEGFEDHARQLAAMYAYEPGILAELLDQLFVLAAADGQLHPAELAWLARVAAVFGLDGPPFEAVLARYGVGPPPRQPPTGEAEAYAALGLAPDAGDAEIKAAWRRLVRDNHPDRLVAQGRSQDEVDRANARLAAINAAYDRIARERGLP